MSPPGRPIKNLSNFLDDVSYNYLVNTAKRYHTEDVSVEELISEGWFKVVRYLSQGKSIKRLFFDLRREMLHYIILKRDKQDIVDTDKRILLRNDNEFCMWLKHRKYKLQR